MKSIKVLDCTLRDGGYVNDWNFGEAAIRDIAKEITASKADIIEMGFLKNEPYDRNRSVFNDIEQLEEMIPENHGDIKYAVMIEPTNTLPVEKLRDRKYDRRSCTIIRVIVWKTKHLEDGTVVDALNEWYEYCRGIVEKGYDLCVQPARVDQYSDEEFVQMIELFSTLKPMAIYVVDSWGILLEEQLLHYTNLADKHMQPDIALGYHGHNNLMQVFHNAISFIRQDYAREVFVDASIYGIGRGAGNLNYELIAAYLNETQYKGEHYTMQSIYPLFDRYIKNIYENEKWGYSIPYYLTAIHNCHPNYARYYSEKVSIAEMGQIMKLIDGDDKVLYTGELAELYLRKFKETKDI